MDRGDRLGRADLLRAASDLRAARIAAGLSLADVGHASGISRSQLSRIEHASVPGASVIQLARIGAVVGLDVRVRSYPGPDPLRDAGQIRLLDRLRHRLGPGLTFQTEVPLPIAGDQRAWDGWIAGLVQRSSSGTSLAVEAETRISDFQAQVRRVMLKMRDGGVNHVLLVVADTRSNRSVLAVVDASIRESFPISGRRALAALATGLHPGGSALVVL